MAHIPMRVIVIGAGYAGLLATVRLAGKVRREVQRGRVSITLVNASDVFVERLRLHQQAANQPVPQRPIGDNLRGTGVAFVCGTVTRLDAAQHTIDVQTGAGAQSFGYDYLIYALGSAIEHARVPGVDEHAYRLMPAGPRSALALRERLPEVNRRGGRLLVCGAGATGIEAAAEFAEAYPHLAVQLVTAGAFGHFTDPGVAAYMRHALERLGVTIREHTTITAVGATDVLTASGTALPYDVCLWTGGFCVPPLAREAGLAVNGRGQVLVDPYLRSVSHPEIWAIGDAAQPVEEPGAPVRMAAYTAVVMGAHGADCLSAVLYDKPPRPFSFAYAGQAIALGRHAAIGFNTYPIDRPNRPYFTGRLGYTLREFFVRLLANLPALERRWPGFFIWLGTGRYAAAQRRRGAQAPGRQRV